MVTEILEIIYLLFLNIDGMNTEIRKKPTKISHKRESFN